MTDAVEAARRVLQKSLYNSAPASDDIDAFEAEVRADERSRAQGAVKAAREAVIVTNTFPTDSVFLHTLSLYEAAVRADERSQAQGESYYALRAAAWEAWRQLSEVENPLYGAIVAADRLKAALDGPAPRGAER